MGSLVALIQIILIDLSLAGDNAIVVGMTAASLPLHQRKKAIIFGLGAATLLRIIMALFAAQLLHFAGLLTAGGLLLLWVGWKMWREIYATGRREALIDKKPTVAEQTRKFSTIILEIIVADFSMSLDNILGVAGVARDHKLELAFGLCLSIGLMGLASAQIAKFAEKYPKIGYVGVVIVLYVALHMIYDGAHQLMRPVSALI